MGTAKKPFTSRNTPSCTQIPIFSLFYIGEIVRALIDRLRLLISPPSPGRYHSPTPRRLAGVVDPVATVIDAVMTADRCVCVKDHIVS